MFRSRLRKITLSGFLVAVCVVASPLSIPIGASRCLPVQHLVNVVTAVIAGPFYSVAVAFIASLLRLFLGTGTLLAFPGSMIGALFAGLLFRRTNKIFLACLGEAVGTGLIGAIFAYPVAAFIIGNNQAALFSFVIPFSISSLGGAVLAAFLLIPLRRTGLLETNLRTGSSFDDFAP